MRFAAVGFECYFRANESGDNGSGGNVRSISGQGGKGLLGSHFPGLCSFRVSCRSAESIVTQDETHRNAGVARRFCDEKRNPGGGGDPDFKGANGCRKCIPATICGL